MDTMTEEIAANWATAQAVDRDETINRRNLLMQLCGCVHPDRSPEPRWLAMARSIARSRLMRDEDKTAKVRPDPETVENILNFAGNDADCKDGFPGLEVVLRTCLEAADVVDSAQNLINASGGGSAKEITESCKTLFHAVCLALKVKKGIHPAEFIESFRKSTTQGLKGTTANARETVRRALDFLANGAGTGIGPDVTGRRTPTALWHLIDYLGDPDAPGAPRSLSPAQPSRFETTVPFAIARYNPNSHLLGTEMPRFRFTRLATHSNAVFINPRQALLWMDSKFATTLLLDVPQAVDTLPRNGPSIDWNADICVTIEDENGQLYSKPLEGNSAGGAAARGLYFCRTGRHDDPDLLIMASVNSAAHVTGVGSVKHKVTGIAPTGRISTFVVAADLDETEANRAIDDLVENGELKKGEITVHKLG